MLMHVCPAGHVALTVKHSLISAAGKTGTVVKRGALPETLRLDCQRSPLPPLQDHQQRCHDALMLDHAAASPGPGFASTHRLKHHLPGPSSCPRTLNASIVHCTESEAASGFQPFHSQVPSESHTWAWQSGCQPDSRTPAVHSFPDRCGAKGDRGGRPLGATLLPRGRPGLLRDWPGPATSQPRSGPSLLQPRLRP